MSSTEHWQSASRASPACVIFLLDHSFSMTESLVRVAAVEARCPGHGDQPLPQRVAPEMPATG